MSEPNNTINPAEPYNDLFNKYFPGVELEVRPYWSMYLFDPAQLARLIEHIEEVVTEEVLTEVYKWHG
jgi:hypothetical protein